MQGPELTLKYCFNDSKISLLHCSISKSKIFSVSNKLLKLYIHVVQVIDIVPHTEPRLPPNIVHIIISLLFI